MNAHFTAVPDTLLQNPRRFADGGQVQETSEELMARMAAKYGISNPRTAQPAPTPQPRPQAQPQSQPGGVINTLRGRGQQIDQVVDKAVRGYADGGKIRGPGTAKSDSIPAQVQETGEPIRVSTGERILSAAQDAYLSKMAKSAGFKSLDEMLEAGTGKPVGPTVKAGKRAAATGMAPEDDPLKKAFGPGTPPSLGSGLAGMTRVIADNPVSPPGASPVAGAPGVTKTLDANGQASYAGVGAPGAAPGRSAMDIYRNEAAMKGLDANTFDRPGGGPKVATIGDSSRMSEKGWANLEMPAGLSARQQASFLNAQEQNQTARRGQDITVRGQDLNHGVALAGQGITVRGQDLNAQAEATRLVGNPLDNALKRENLATAQRLGNLQSRYTSEQDPAKQDILGHQLRTLTGRASPYGDGPTLAQQRGNSEIDAARERVAGLSPDEIKRKTQQFSATGRENPEYDSTLARATTLANRRKVGADDVFDAQQKASQAPGAESDAQARFQADKAMAGHRLGKQTKQGMEVFDNAGRLVGHYQ